MTKRARTRYTALYSNVSKLKTYKCYNIMSVLSTVSFCFMRTDKM